MNKREIRELTIKAEQGDAEKQFLLGSCYYDGAGVRRDPAMAVKWFRKAAGQDNADAQYWLGRCCYYGIGVEKDRPQALAWFHRAADQGHASAQNELRKHAVAMRDIELYEKGVLLFEGKGVPRNVSEAVKCFCEAANDGNVRAIIKVIDLDEAGGPEVREAIARYADDTLKRRLEYFRDHQNGDGASHE